jgi:transposase
MAIVGGLDIHRKQLTFDYLDQASGEVVCGRVSPADREHLAEWLRRFAGVDRVCFAVEACTGWRYVTECLQAAGVQVLLAEPADTAAARGRKKRAKTDRADSRLLRELAEGGRVPQCWIPPQQVLEYRAVLELYHDLRREHTAWVQRVHAVCFHQGAEHLGTGGLGTEEGRARLRQLAQTQLSPAGRVQIDTSLQMLDTLETRLAGIRRRLLAAARHVRGAKVLTDRLYGVGPVTALALVCWLGGAGRFSSSRKAVRFAGLDVTVYSSDGKHKPRPAVPARPAGAALVPVRGRQDPRPHRCSRPCLLRGRQGPTRRQTRGHLRSPQDRPPSLPHPHRPRRRRIRPRLTRRRWTFSRARHHTGHSATTQMGTTAARSRQEPARPLLPRRTRTASTD